MNDGLAILPDSIAASDVPPARASRRHHWAVLIVSIAIVLLAFSLQVVEGGHRIAFAFMPEHPLPDLCLSQILMNEDCPGCGVTRCFVSIAHGDFPAAWEFNRVGCLLALLTLLQIPYRLYCLRTGRIISPRVSWWIGVHLAGLLLVNWVLHVLNF